MNFSNISKLFIFITVFYLSIIFTYISQCPVLDADFDEENTYPPLPPSEEPRPDDRYSSDDDVSDKDNEEYPVSEETPSDKDIPTWDDENATNETNRKNGDDNYGYDYEYYGVTQADVKPKGITSNYFVFEIIVNWALTVYVRGKFR